MPRSASTTAARAHLRGLVLEDGAVLDEPKDEGVHVGGLVVAAGPGGPVFHRPEPVAHQARQRPRVVADVLRLPGVHAGARSQSGRSRSVVSVNPYARSSPTTRSKVAEAGRSPRAAYRMGRSI
jgi:hypothetical protein